MLSVIMIQDLAMGVGVADLNDLKAQYIYVYKTPVSLLESMISIDHQIFSSVS